MAWRRSFRQRFGISAPRVAVRTHIPWYWRGLLILVVGTIAAWVGWGAYDNGRIVPPFLRDDAARTVSELRHTITRQEREIAELRTRAVRAERQLEMGNATYGDVAREIKALTEQNAALREDLAFFQSLMPAGSGKGGIAVERFRLEKEALPGEYRYRLFLVQTGQRDRDFEGRLQVVVNVVEHGAARALILPADGERDARDYQLRFKFFQRVEGTFRVSADAAVRNVQVRVYEQGSRAPKLAQTVNAT